MSEEIITQPLKGVLDRELAVASVKELTDKYSPYLQELINYSTGLLGRCEKSLKGVKGTPASLIHIYYHVIQMTDGIEVLASKGCFVVAAPLHRSLLEATMSMDYMLEDDFESRSAAWLVGSSFSRKAFMESLDPESEKGKKFLEKISIDRIIEPDFLPQVDQDVLRKDLALFDRQLKKPKLAQFAKEFSGKARIKRWYQINAGPADFYQLADKLKRPLEYEIFYRQDSEIIHAVDSSRMLSQVEGKVVMTPIRPGTESLEILYISTGSMLNLSFLLIASKLRPDESVREKILAIIARHRPEMVSP